MKTIEKEREIPDFYLWMGEPMLSRRVKQQEEWGNPIPMGGSNIDWQWFNRNREQNAANAMRAAQWAIKLRFTRG